MNDPWLLLDVGIPADTYRELEEGGIPVVHAGVEGLASEGAQQLLEYAIADGCVIVTRNYADFSRLAEAYADAGRTLPGILFIPPTLDSRDTHAHARAIAGWYRENEGDAARIQGRVTWLELEP